MSETIEVTKREGVGSIASRKLRRTGQVPAILYGHGEDNVNLSLKSDVIGRVIQQGTKLLSLTGDVTDTALLRDVQWDSFGIEVLHVDLTRVSQTEAVEVTLPVELHGVAPGSSEGGVLAFARHELTISCPASSIPDQIQVSIVNLHLGEAIHAGEVTLPEGASMVTNASEVVVQINKALVEADDSADEEAVSEVEPELIRKDKEGEGAEATSGE